MEANDNTAAKIQNMVESMPIDLIIETAETVAPLIPVAGKAIAIIIKVLRVLKAIQPAAGATANMFAKINENEANAPKETFNRMWDIAMIDGVITDEEKKFLLPYAVKAGISEPEFELMVMNKQRL